MRHFRLLVFLLVVTSMYVWVSQLEEPHDPHRWLEEVEGSRPVLGGGAQRRHPEKIRVETRLQKDLPTRLSILDSKEKLVYPRVLGRDVYNFWRDHKHERGLLRRQSMDAFLKGKKRWETVLDVDALASREGENWVFHGHQPLAPDYRRTLVWLSRGGSDAAVVREFDLTTLDFVEDGFSLPEAKHRIAWRDHDSLYVGTDYGPDSMTDSGYPRIIKIWHRGTPLSEAKTLIEIPKEEVSVGASVSRCPEGQYDFVTRAVDFWNSQTFMVVGGELKRIPIPSDAHRGPVYKGQLLITLCSKLALEGEVLPPGSVISLDIEELKHGRLKAHVLHNPDQEEGFVNGLAALRDSVVVTLSKTSPPN